MSIKYIAAAAALFSSAGVVAQPLNMRTHNTASARSAAVSRHAVLDNIIGRVQMDALISTIVASDTKASVQRRTVAYAAAEPVKLRARS